MRALAQLTVVLALLALFALPFVKASRQDNQDRWVGDEYSATLNAVFPIEKKFGRYVGYRYSHPHDPDDLEHSFIIGFLPKINAPGLQNTISADLRSADTTPIWKQLTALHRAKPKKPLKGLLPEFKIRVFHITETECPVVRTQFEKFKKVQFGPVYDDRISIDPPGYEFRVTTIQGWLDTTVFDDQNPLVVWAIETRSGLQACVSNAAAPNALRN